MSPVAHFAKLSAKRSGSSAHAPLTPSSHPYPTGSRRRAACGVLRDDREVDDVPDLVQDDAVDAAAAVARATVAKSTVTM